MVPEAPKDVSLADLTAALKSHYEPKHLIIAECFHFHRRNQAAGKSITKYVAELRRLAAKCAFGDYLKEAL